jgi:hypothetical protein
MEFHDTDWSETYMPAELRAHLASPARFTAQLPADAAHDIPDESALVVRMPAPLAPRRLPAFLSLEAKPVAALAAKFKAANPRARIDARLSPAFEKVAAAFKSGIAVWQRRRNFKSTFSARPK